MTPLAAVLIVLIPEYLYLKDGRDRKPDFRTILRLVAKIVLMFLCYTPLWGMLDNLAFMHSILPLDWFLFFSLLSIGLYSYDFVLLHLPLLLVLRFVMVRSCRTYTRADDHRFAVIAAVFALLTVPFHWNIANQEHIKASAYECEAHAIGCELPRRIMWEFALASPLAAYAAARVLARDV